MPSSDRPSSEELAGLAEKYATLRALRRSKQAGAPEPPKPTFRDLAVQYPGALKELELLEEAELTRREAALREAARGASEIEPWMIAIHVFHRALREAIAGKTSTKTPSGPLLDLACITAADASTLSVDEIRQLVKRRR